MTGLTSSSGSLLARYSYDPFGQTRSVWTPTRVLVADPFVPLGDAVLSAANPQSEAIARANPFRFASSYLDPTGLYHMGERYYDPALGRFTQQDPIHNPLDPKSWNRYVYVGNDPVNFVDPSGLNAFTDWFCAPFRDFSALQRAMGGAGAGLILDGVGLATVVGDVSIRALTAVAGPSLARITLGVIGGIELAATAVIVGLIAC